MGSSFIPPIFGGGLIRRGGRPPEPEDIRRQMEEERLAGVSIAGAGVVERMKEESERQSFLNFLRDKPEVANQMFRSGQLTTAEYAEVSNEVLTVPEIIGDIIQRPQRSRMAGAEALGFEEGLSAALAANNPVTGNLIAAMQLGIGGSRGLFNLGKALLTHPVETVKEGGSELKNFFRRMGSLIDTSPFITEFGLRLAGITEPERIEEARREAEIALVTADPAELTRAREEGIGLAASILAGRAGSKIAGEALRSQILLERLAGRTALLGGEIAPFSLAISKDLEEAAEVQATVMALFWPTSMVWNTVKYVRDIGKIKSGDIPSTTPKSIRRALARFKSNEGYDALAKLREFDDWAMEARRTPTPEQSQRIFAEKATTGAQDAAAAKEGFVFHNGELVAASEDVVKARQAGLNTVVDEQLRITRRAEGKGISDDILSAAEVDDIMGFGDNSGMSTNQILRRGRARIAESKASLKQASDALAVQSRTGVPLRDAAPTGGAEAAAENAAFVAMIRNNANINQALVDLAADIPSDLVVVMRAVEKPAEVIEAYKAALGRRRGIGRLFPGRAERLQIGIHPRGDGLFDVAFGGPESQLAASRGTFFDTGHYVGERVSIEGTEATFVARDGGDALVVTPLSDQRLTVNLNRVRPHSWPIAGVSEEQLAAFKALVTPEDFARLQEVAETLRSKPPRVDETAFSNSVRIEKGAPGEWIVVDDLLGQITEGGFLSIEEAQSFVNRLTQSKGPVIPGATDIPIEVLNSIGMPVPRTPGGGLSRGALSPFNTPELTSAFLRRSVRGIRDFKARNIPWLTMRKNTFIAFDEQFGTNTVANIYDRVMDSKSLTTSQKEAWIRRIGELADEFKDISPERRATVGSFMEFMPLAEMLEEGLVVGRLPTEIEILFSKQLSGLRVNLKQVYGYEIDLLRTMRKRIHEYIADGQITLPEGISSSHIPRNVLREIFPAAELETIQNELLRRHKMFDPGFREAIDIFDEILTKDMNEASLYHVTTMANKIRFEEALGPMTRAEYAARIELTPREMALAEASQKIFKEMADIFGVQETQRIRGYMYHGSYLNEFSPREATLFQKTNDSALLKSLESSEEIYRSGANTQYTLDPLQSLSQYTNAMFNRRFLVETLNESASSLRNMFEALEKANPQLKGTYTWTLQKKAMVDFLNNARSVNYTDFDVAISSLDELLENVLGKREAQSVSQGTKNKILNNGMALTSGAFFGGRPILGWRDFLTDYLAKYSTRFGFRRAARGLKYADMDLVATLLTQGELTEISPVRFLEEAAEGAISRRISSTADAALKTSGQPQIHLMVQGMAFGEMLETVSIWGTKVLRNEATFARAANEIGLETFGIPVREEFRRKLFASGSENAGKYLARQAAHEMSISYRALNAPMGWRNPVGRLVTQYGIWGVNTVDYTLGALSRGDRAKFMGTITRALTNEMGIQAFGLATGVNTTFWSPFIGSAAFGAGPMLETLVAVPQLVSLYEPDRRDAWRTFGRTIPFTSGDDFRSSLIPFSYGLYGAYRALTDPEIAPIQRAFTFMGGTPTRRQ